MVIMVKPEAMQQQQPVRKTVVFAKHQERPTAIRQCTVASQLKKSLRKMVASTGKGLRPFTKYVCKKVINANCVLLAVIRSKIVIRQNPSPNALKKLNMAKERERLVAKITTNFCTMRQPHLNLIQDQHQEELQGNSRQSQLEQKGAQISRGEVIGDQMLLLQVELELREVLEAKIISLKVTQTPHLKTSKEQWSPTTM